jgi:hypothetical protein
VTRLVPPVDRRAVLVFAALVVVLLAPWPRWGRAFAASFAAYGNALIALTSASSPSPRFGMPARGAVSAADGGDWAVVLTLGDRVAPLDTRIIAYTPLAIFVALALATPVARRRKLVILGGGLAVLLARLAFAVLMPVGSAVAGADGPGFDSAAGIAWTVLVTPPAMSYAAPLAVWWVAVALTTPRPARAAAPRAQRRRRAAPARTGSAARALRGR